MQSPTKFLSLISIIIIALLSSGTQCNKNYIDQKSYNHFLEKIDLQPSKKAYSLGDTIWLEFQRPNKKLFESISKKYILVDSASITIQFGFGTPDYYPSNLPSAGLCDYLTINGGVINKFQNQDEGLMATFGCNSENSYYFKIGIVLKQKGVFQISFTGVSRQVAKCDSSNSNFPFSDIQFTFNLSDCNKDVFLSLSPNIQGYFSGEDLDYKKAFIFIVQ